MKVVIRYGVSTKKMYGMVTLQNRCHQLAPSISAASYSSVGTFWRIPVICMMVYGIPIHRLITITVTRAHVAFDSHGSGPLIQPQLSSKRLIAPSRWSMVCITSRDTNCGTAMDIEKHARQKALPLMVLRSMIMAMNIPRKKFRKVAKNAQISVHASTEKNSLAFTSPPLLPSTVPKFFRPTQENRTVWFWS